MRITEKVKKILSYYSNENLSIQFKLCQLLMHGRLAGTGKLVILPVDQGFEHGAARSFAKNSPAYDPDYHFKLAINAGLSAYAAPFGFLAAASSKFVGQVPTILKLNSSNALTSKSESPDQAITSSVKDAVELGCGAVGLTIYPGSPKAFSMFEEAREIVREAKSYGLPTVIWSYPRGGNLSKDGETAVDVCAYAAHMAALLGAHIIKVKPPTAYLENPEAKKVYLAENIKIDTLASRVQHVVQSCFNGKRLVVFSGGGSKSENAVLKEVEAIRDGGGSGSIIGRNSFQRPYDQALELLQNICKIYKSYAKMS